MKEFSFELLELIAEHLVSAQDISCLSQVNHHFYSGVTRLLYKHVMITGPRQYLSFQSVKNEALLNFVQRLDLSSYTTKGSRYSVEKAKSIVLANELANLILKCKNLKELFVGEELMHAFVSPRVIRSIFNIKNNLTTLDFTGFCDRTFTTVIIDMFKPNMSTKLDNKISTTTTTSSSSTNCEVLEEENWSIPSRLTNISFYMCMALSQEQFFIPFFDKISANGNQLTRLDLAYTQITSDLFTHILNNSFKQLTHLNLQGCHSLSCCSPLISFIEQCKQLIELNLNMDFYGIGGSRFCSECIYKILKSTSKLNTLTSLDMGGHTSLNDDMILALLKQQDIVFLGLEKLSITYCKDISLKVLQELLTNLNNLYYLNLARTPLTMNLNYLPRVLNQLSNHPIIKVIEISPFTPKKYPPIINQWMLSSQGRRTYYSRHSVNPKFIHSKKMLMLNHQILSPMNKYWCYSY